ncbi:hypothetical protein AVEN_62975-1 [Araneus ventricosus]|uniref:Uncharacterized protein n=1 Tax=Araneus ventricosus TaxID=182803 RepID=A0A4Y2KHK0_ARAVE|nr:hypothetical protein AVEN_62975-1 [Araneus ventricosus]
MLLDINRSARNEFVIIWTFARRTLIAREKPLLILYYTLLPSSSSPIGTNEILFHLGSTVRNKSHSDDGDANFEFLSSPFTISLLSSSPCQPLQEFDSFLFSSPGPSPFSQNWKRSSASAHVSALVITPASLSVSKKPPNTLF